MIGHLQSLFSRIRRRVSGGGSKPAGARTEAQRLGDEGESRALEALRNRGLRLLARNWRADRGELDLIMREGGIVVFVEVRTHHGSPVKAYASVGRKKRRVLRRTAKAYLRQLRDRPRTVRFDIVAVDLDTPGRDGVHHFREIPLFGKHFVP
ncbi:MAG: YraN family protein [Opitutales bacterium]|nr:YraN family protein [Opitutales bacterium]